MTFTFYIWRTEALTDSSRTAGLGTAVGGEENKPWLPSCAHHIFESERRKRVREGIVCSEVGCGHQIALT